MMAAKFLTRGWRITLIVVSCVFVIVLTLLLFINSYLTPKLSEKLKSAVLKGSDSLYRINFSKVDLHVLRGNAVLYNITLVPDTAVYHQLQRRGTAPAEIYELRVKQLVITDAHPFKLYFHKQLDIGKLTLDNPDVQVSKYVVQKDTAQKAGSTLYSKLTPELKFIHVGTINLNKINATYRNCTGPKPEVLVLKEMNLAATDLLIDSATQNDKTRSLFCRDIVTDLHHFKWKTADGIYLFKVNSVQLSTRTARLIITGGEMQPIAAPAFFAGSKKKWDRYTVHFDSVTLSHFDYQSFRKHQDLDAAHMTVTKGFFEIYPNANRPPQTTDRVVTYPNYVIRHLQSSLNIDTLDIKHMDVVLRMYNKSSMQAGAVKFINTTGRFLNITNKKAIIAQHPDAIVNLTTYLMGKGKLDVAFIFNLTAPDYHYSYTGHLGPLDMLAGNAATMPLGLIQVQSGTNKSLNFSIHGNNRSAVGKVVFLYNNLKIALLRHDQQNGYTKKALISLLANLVVIKNNNPDDDHTPPRFANVVYKRPANITFFASIWQTILAGVKPCAGLGKAEKKAPNAALTEKDQKAQAKALKKEQKKQAKAQKKAEKKAKKEEKKFKKQQEKLQQNK